MIRLLLRLYPHDWRVRYEDEFMAMLEQYRPGFSDLLDIIRCALLARWQRSNRMRLSTLRWGRRGLAVMLMYMGLSSLVLSLAIVPPWTQAEVSGTLLRYGVPGYGDFGIMVRLDDGTTYAGYINDDITGYFAGDAFAADLRMGDRVYLTPFATPTLQLFGERASRPIAGVRTDARTYLAHMEMSALYANGATNMRISSVVMLMLGLLLLLPDVRGGRRRYVVA